MNVSEESVFAEALQRQDPRERASYLDRACAGDPELRRNVESLLSAYQRGQFLESPALEVTTDQPPAAAEGPGAEVGPYRLLEQIGEGGMGLVFLAEQRRPVRRQVALKLLKPGMDSRHVLARFEAERQALALMDHPNVAKILDAGGTASGRPYFVMELVRGVPITEYCDRHGLTVRQRLELFGRVCAAVQHAHQKGVIHRDLKPSNVLVAHDDVQPLPKVIDFGIAKAVSQPLTERTLFTELSQFVGTPAYASPEQASLNHLDVDTRSDVYSLGVLLYELLTGTMPFERERLRGAGLDEVRRIISEEEPPRPSARVSTAGATATPAAQRRGTDLRRLALALRGELDWVVMRCLEKDRNRRYESPGALAADLNRHLRDEPVEARPPSAGYRLGKFVRRNKRPVVAAALVLLSLVGGAAGTTWGMLRARGAEAAAVAEAAEKQAALERARESEEEAKKSAAFAHEQWVNAERNYLKTITPVRLLADHARMLKEAGRGDDARQAARQVGDLMAGLIDAALAPQGPPIAHKTMAKAIEEFNSYQLYVELCNEVGAPETAARLAAKVLALLDALEAGGYPEKDRDFLEVRRATMWGLLGDTFGGMGQAAPAEDAFQRAEAAWGRQLAYVASDPDLKKAGTGAFFEPFVPQARFRQGEMQLAGQKYQQAEQSFLAARQRIEAAREPALPAYAFYVHKGLGDLYWETGRRERAEAEYEAALKMLGKHKELKGELVPFLLTCPHEGLRDPARAAKLVEGPEDQRWLPLAYYRQGKYRAACDENQKQVPLAAFLTPVDKVVRLLVLAMARERSGDHAGATLALQGAIRGIDDQKLESVLVRRMLQEARQLPGLKAAIEAHAAGRAK